MILPICKIGRLGYIGDMSSAASVAAVAAPSRGDSASWVAQSAVARHAQTPKASSHVVQTSAAQHVAPAPAAPVGSSIDPRLPLGLLLSVSPPAAGDVSASSDYEAMETALRTDNLVAAQQAYTRLQTDLQLTSSTASAIASAQSKSEALNVVA